MEGVKCFNNFFKDSFWKDYSFKILNKGYPEFEYPKDKMSIVKFEHFADNENSKIPLLVGSQFGIHPNPKEVFRGVDKVLLVARLNKSLLSGVVHGLGLYIYHKENFKEVAYFKSSEK